MAEEKRLMKGNEAIGEAAIRAGCDAYFGYPITPQNELTAYMAGGMLDRGRVFIQAESEVAAMSMVYGASAAGGRAMTSSSSPGVSLKQEGISYACGADLPCVVVNVARAGPGLGGIAPSQGDYFQATRGGGHGDYYHIVLAPKSVQEAADLTYEAFELADTWRMPVMILADGLIGQMMEGVVLPPSRDASKRHLYLGATNSWIHESVDAGASWHWLSKLDSVDGLIIDNIVVVDAANPAIVYVAAWKVDAPGGGLWVSRDGGRTWSVSAGPARAVDSRICAGALRPQNPFCGNP